MKRPALLPSRLALLLAACLALPAAAQPASPLVNLTRPTAGAANRLDLLRSAEASVAVLNPLVTAAEVPGSAAAVRDAVFQWELFLLGLNVPYRVVDDRELARGVPGGTRVLILPVAEALSDAQRRQIQRHLERGGGVLASGRVGFFDQDGRTVGDAFFRQVFGAELVTGLPEQPSGILQSLDGGHAPTFGLPMGYRLNLAPPSPMTAARPLASTGLGRPYPYTPDPTGQDPFANVTLALYGTSGAGNVAWFRFHPQDVSREAEQQAVYQGLVLNTLAYLAGVPSAGLRPWPNGQQSATVLAAQPLVGNDVNFLTGTSRALDVLEAAGAPGTFFLTSEEAVLFPDLVRRMDALGEVALSADADDVLKNEPPEVQTQRLEKALADLRTLVPTPVVGLAPPGGFYDVGTVRAMRQTGLRYLLLPAEGESAAPRPLDWFRDADYRETLVADATGGAVAAPRQAALGDRILALPTTGRDDYTVLNVLGNGGDPAAQLAAYRADFGRVHAAHGLYVLPYHAALQALTDERAAVLGQLAETARRQGSWVTTLGDVHQWWLQHEQLGLTVGDVTDRSITIDLLNASNQPVTNVSVDVVPGGLVTGVTADGGAVVRPWGNGQVVTVTIPTVRSGTNRITLSFNRR